MRDARALDGIEGDYLRRRGLFQYGLRHLGQVMGGVSDFGTHLWPQRWHCQPMKVMGTRETGFGTAGKCSTAHSCWTIWGIPYCGATQFVAALFGIPSLVHHALAIFHLAPHVRDRHNPRFASGAPLRGVDPYITGRAGVFAGGQRCLVHAMGSVISGRSR